MNKQPAPYQCHIFICTNVRENNPDNPGCGTKGGPSLKDLLKKAVSERGWKGKVRVSTSGCMGLCAQGPNVVLYPQGIHFSAVTEADLPAILDVAEQQLSKEQNIWFPVKRYGYGWGLPCCWQGWLVFIGYILLMSAAPRFMELKDLSLYMLAITAGFIAIVIWKGGKPRWRWGK